MIQILLHGLKMDPLVSLHYYAPVCALINSLVLPFTEGLAPFYELARIGPLILISNACVAFLLNVAAVFLVGAGSGLVLTLAGVFKVSRSDYRAHQLLMFCFCLSGHFVDFWFRAPIWGPNHSPPSLWVLGCTRWPRLVQDIWEQIMVMAPSYSIEYNCFFDLFGRRRTVILMHYFVSDIVIGAHNQGSHITT